MCRRPPAAAGHRWPPPSPLGGAASRAPIVTSRRGPRAQRRAVCLPATLPDPARAAPPPSSLAPVQSVWPSPSFAQHARSLTSSQPSICAPRFRVRSLRASPGPLLPVPEVHRRPVRLSRREQGDTADPSAKQRAFRALGLLRLRVRFGRVSALKVHHHAWPGLHLLSALFLGRACPHNHSTHSFKAASQPSLPRPVSFYIIQRENARPYSLFLRSRSSSP